MSPEEQLALDALNAEKATIMGTAFSQLRYYSNARESELKSAGFKTKADAYTFTVERTLKLLTAAEKLFLAKFPD